MGTVEKNFGYLVLIEGIVRNVSKQRFTEFCVSFKE
jgi:hypothetical protein